MSAAPTVTICDIARLAGVSETTVSLAFRPGSRISTATRERVLAIAAEHHYVPNQAARQLRQRRSTTVGMLVPDLTDSFYTRLARATETRLAEAGYQLLLSESNWNSDKELQAISSMVEARLCGLLYCSVESNEAGSDLLATHNIPFLMLDTCPPGYPNAAVITDFPRLGADAAKHLASNGYGHPAIITASRPRSRYSSLLAMSDGFRQAWGATTPIYEAGLQRADGRRAAEQALDADCDALFCHHDALALGAMEAIVARGLHPGHDIGVLGVDNTDFGDSPLIGLSSFALPFRQIAALACDALLAHLDADAPLSIRHHLQAHLCRRQSSQRPEL